MKPCPYCGEKIQDNALKCKFCGEWLNQKHAAVKENGSQRKKAKSNTKIWISIAGVAIVSFIIIVIISIADDFEDTFDKGADSQSVFKNGEGLQQTIDNKKEKPEDKIYKIEEPVQVGNFIFSVGSVVTLTDISDGFTTYKANGIYKVIIMGVQNIDKEAHYLDTSMFKLVDNKGRIFKSSVESNIYISMKMKDVSNLFLEQINPSILVLGVVVFDIPDDTEGLKMEISGGMFSSEKEYVDLGSEGFNELADKKAKGRVTIYNEYGPNPQPLVATTRLLSESGKTFRLVEGVTVPGFKKTNNGIEAGTIGVDVISDGLGEEYIIGPSRFVIPGFKSIAEEKYSKIYAKSEEAMMEED